MGEMKRKMEENGYAPECFVQAGKRTNLVFSGSWGVHNEYKQNSGVRVGLHSGPNHVLELGLWFGKLLFE